MLGKLKQKLAEFVYGLAGVTGVASFFWALIMIIMGKFFSTMGTLGSIGFFIAVIAMLNWGIKLVKGTDFFGN